MQAPVAGGRGRRGRTSDGCLLPAAGPAAAPGPFGGDALGGQPELLQVRLDVEQAEPCRAPGREGLRAWVLWWVAVVAMVVVCVCVGGKGGEGMKRGAVQWGAGLGGCGRLPVRCRADSPPRSTAGAALAARTFHAHVQHDLLGRGALSAPQRVDRGEEELVQLGRPAQPALAAWRRDAASSRRQACRQAG